MFLVTGLYSFVQHTLTPSEDEDLVDRIINRIIPTVLVAVGLSVFAREYGGAPLKCWSKAEWPFSWEQYASDLCFVEGTYYVGVNSTLPAYDDLNDFKKLRFYQWMPFLFVLSGLLCTVPRSFWTHINSRSPFQVIGMTTLARRNRRLGEMNREFLLAGTKHWIKALQISKRACKNNIVSRLWKTMFSGASLTITYFFVKLWNLLSLVIVIVVLSTMIAEEPSDYFGLSTISALNSGRNWRETGLFPRLSVCAFKIREIGVQSSSHMSKKVLQCVLLINMFTEKVFFIMWYCLVLTLAVGVVNLVRWILCYNEQSRHAFVSQLTTMHMNTILPLPDECPKLKERNAHEQRQVMKYHKVYLDATQIGDKTAINRTRADYMDVYNEALQLRSDRTTKRLQKRELYLAGLDKNVKQFTDYLTADGYLLLRLVHDNSGPMIAGSFAGKLFWKFLKEKKEN